MVGITWFDISHWDSSIETQDIPEALKKAEEASVEAAAAAARAGKIFLEPCLMESYTVKPERHISSHLIWALDVSPRSWTCWLILLIPSQLPLRFSKPGASKGGWKPWAAAKAESREWGIKGPSSAYFPGEGKQCPNQGTSGGPFNNLSRIWRATISQQAPESCDWGPGASSSREQWCASSETLSGRNRASFATTSPPGWSCDNFWAFSSPGWSRPSSTKSSPGWSSAILSSYVCQSHERAAYSNGFISSQVI